MFKRFEEWTKRVYRPEKANWKRPALLLLSILMGSACCVASYTQFHFRWTNDGVWFVIGLFGIFSLIGFCVSIFCKDHWVALVLGRPDF